MNRNTKPAICCFCHQPVGVGLGRFVGPGRVSHNKDTCLGRIRTLYAPKPSPKKLIAIGNRWLAP